MLSNFQLREQLIRLLSGDISLDDFDNWFAGESWNIHKSSDLMAQRLAYAVELRLAEYDDGHLSEPVLLDELRSLVRNYSLLLSDVIVSVGTGSSSRLDIHDWAIQRPWAMPSVDRPRAKAF